mmetsp:Transcript_28985/g.53096  ORF Transcript_28985/g.53096 Transcript_28985/m.53096 type:complete len:273 (-) Transcript_28985:53-871(-)
MNTDAVPAGRKGCFRKQSLPCIFAGSDSASRSNTHLQFPAGSSSSLLNLPHVHGLTRKDLPSDQTFECQVSGLSGVLCTILASPHWTVADLKGAVQEASGIPMGCQQLIHELCELHNSHALRELVSGVQVEFTLLRRPPYQQEWIEKIKLHASAVLRDAPDHVRADRAVMQVAVEGNGKALRFATEDLRADRDLVLRAVSQNGRALQFAAEDLRADHDIVTAALKQNADSFRFVSKSIRANFTRFVITRSCEQYGNDKSLSQWRRISESRST